MEPDRFSVTVPASARYLQAIRGFFKPILQERLGEAAEGLVLALDESCANVLKHNPARIASCGLQIEAEFEPSRLRFRIRNFCANEDLPRIHPRDLHQVRPGGLGTHFVGQIMDRIEFEPQAGCPGVMTLVLEKSLPPAAGPRPGGN